LTTTLTTVMCAVQIGRHSVGVVLQSEVSSRSFKVVLKFSCNCWNLCTTWCLFNMSWHRLLVCLNQ